MGKPSENKTVLLYKLYLLVFLLFTKIIYLEKKIIYLSIRSSLGLGTGHYLSPGRGGGGKDLGLNKVKFIRSHH